MAGLSSYPRVGGLRSAWQSMLLSHVTRVLTVVDIFAESLGGMEEVEEKLRVVDGEVWAVRKRWEHREWEREEPRETEEWKGSDEKEGGRGGSSRIRKGGRTWQDLRSGEEREMHVKEFRELEDKK